MAVVENLCNNNYLVADRQSIRVAAATDSDPIALLASQLATLTNKLDAVIAGPPQSSPKAIHLWKM